MDNAPDRAPGFTILGSRAAASGHPRAASGSCPGLALLLGDFFFRWRSFLPWFLVPILILLTAHSQYDLTPWADLWWEIGCVLLAVAGWVLRVYTVGTAAPGTSGRNTREQKARPLNTTGPYSVLRHPLYAANSIIAVALAMFPHGWMVPLLVTGALIGYYGCMARREDEFLCERFGWAFEAWRVRTHAFVPRASTWTPAARSFDWRIAARREFYALAIILVAPLFMDALEGWHESGSPEIDSLWLTSAIVGGTVFIVFRHLKKQTTLLAGR